jgi:quercetin dioxygenase-like cupin family protein
VFHFVKQKEAGILFTNDGARVTIVDDKVSRRLLVCGGTLMMTEVTFKKGGIGTPHAHVDHEQVSRVMAGSFEATIGDKTLVLLPGDGFYAARGIVHGVVALEDSVILDIFTPPRADFL